MAGALSGIRPIWASEIEAYPLSVTSKRFPYVQQLMDVTKIDGGKIAPVDIITFGSPCQDLSVAGKRAGIHEGARSSLFFEAIRIIKEMRNATADKFPRFAIWENVPGAFSSHKGADFRSVLQAFCEIQDGRVHVPRPSRGGWKHAGCIVGNGYSIAWRLYDAQFWGVPQRRKRIYLIADFGSKRAGEILFERESVRGNTTESGEARETIADDADRGARGSGNPVYCLQGNGIDRADTAGCNGKGWREGQCYTLNTIDRPAIVYTVQGFGEYKNGDAESRLRAMNFKGVTDWVAYDCRGNGNGNTVPTLIGNHQNRITDYTSIVTRKPNKPTRKYIVRRLTPLECCRLQGFPDWWEDGADGSDSARYKMWGNGIALPCATDVLARIAHAMTLGGTDDQSGELQGL